MHQNIPSRSSYDEWLIREVTDAMNDKSPMIPHEQVMHDLAQTIKYVKKAHLVPA